MKTILLIPVVLFFSCTTQKKCFDKFPPPPPSIERVTEKVVEYRDTTIYVYIHADTIRKTDTIIIDKEGRVNYPLHRIDLQYAFSTFQVVNNKLDHRLYQKETAIAQTIENAIKEATTTEITVIREPYPVPMPVSWWNQTMIRMGYVLLLLLALTAGYIALKIIKKRFGM